MVDLTSPPDAPDSTSDLMKWGKYAAIAGLASAAWSVGDRYVGGLAESAIDSTVGQVLPSSDSDDTGIRVG